MKSFFKDPIAKKEVEQMYKDKLDELPVTYKFQRVETSFGNTNIVICGKLDGPPLVMVHGANGCAPIAIEAMIGLTESFRVYSIDVIGQPNLSEGYRPDMSDDSYGKWMYEILSRLNIKDAILVGVSFGGFICLKTLLFDETRISRCFLIVPAAIATGNPLKVIWKTMIPLKLYMKSKNTRHAKRFLKELFTDEDEFALAYLSKVLFSFDMDFSPIPMIRNEEARQITTPIHIIGADNDIFFPGPKIIKRARRIFPSLESDLLLYDSKHVPGEIHNAQIVELINNYL